MASKKPRGYVVDDLPHKIKCTSCGYVMTENYCSRCGEKRFEPHDLTIQHLAEETFEGFTHFDNKFFRSAKLLITKPGLLSADFCRGKRVPYMRPFALFFVCNLLFFVIIGPSNVFSLSLHNFYHYKPFTNFHTREIINQLATNEESYAAVARIFNENMAVQSKAFLFFFIPFLALGGLLVRRKNPLSTHLVFSTHYFSFIILYYTITQVLVAVPFYYLTGENYNSTFDLIYSLSALSMFITYYSLAARRFYEVSTVKAVLGALFASMLFIIVLYCYRFLLFYKIINAISL